jgi:hypothetical protein
VPASRAEQLNGDWLWIPQRLRFAPYAQDCAVHVWPLTHSALRAQSCAPAAPPGHAPPLVTAWHEVVATLPVSRPQQAWPEGQSQACVHPKVTAKAPVQPVVLAEQLHVPWTTPPTMPVGVKQQSFERRSQVDVPQAGAVYEEQLPASAPPELLDEEPPLEDDEPPPEEEPPPDEEDPLEEELPPDDEAAPDDDAAPDDEAAPDDDAAPDEEVPPEEELLEDEEASTVASRASTEASTMPVR